MSKTPLKKFRVLREKTVWVETFIEAKTQKQAEKLLDKSDMLGGKHKLRWKKSANGLGSDLHETDTLFCDGVEVKFSPFPAFVFRKPVEV